MEIIGCQAGATSTDLYAGRQHNIQEERGRRTSQIIHSHLKKEFTPLYCTLSPEGPTAYPGKWNVSRCADAPEAGRSAAALLSQSLL